MQIDPLSTQQCLVSTTVGLPHQQDSLLKEFGWISCFPNPFHFISLTNSTQLFPWLLQFSIISCSSECVYCSGAVCTISYNSLSCIFYQCSLSICLAPQLSCDVSVSQESHFYTSGHSFSNQDIGCFLCARNTSLIQMEVPALEELMAQDGAEADT